MLLSRAGSFISSIVASIVAALCLAHLAPPAFSFRVDDPFEDLAIIAFLIASSVIAYLMSRVRKRADEALSSVSYKVIEAEEQERQRIAKDFHEGIVQRLILLVIEIDQLKAALPNKFDAPGRVDAALRQIYGSSGLTAVAVYGPPSACISGLREVADAGAEFIQLRLLYDDAEQMERLAAEVIGEVQKETNADGR